MNAFVIFKPEDINPTSKEFGEMFGYCPIQLAYTELEKERQSHINKLFDTMWSRFNLNTLAIFIKVLGSEVGYRKHRNLVLIEQGGILSCPQIIIDYCEAQLIGAAR